MSPGSINHYEENRAFYQRKAYEILEDIDEGEGLTDNEFLEEWFSKYEKPKQYGRWALYDFISGEAEEEKFDRVEREKSEKGYVYTLYKEEDKYDKKRVVTSAERRMDKWTSDLTRELGINDISIAPIDLFEDWVNRKDSYSKSNWEMDKHQHFEDYKKGLWEEVLVVSQELKKMKDIAIYLEVVNSTNFDEYEIRIEQRKLKGKPMRIVGRGEGFPTAKDSQKMYGEPIRSKIIENKIRDAEEIIRCVENMVQGINDASLLESTINDLEKWKEPQNLDEIKRWLEKGKEEQFFRSNQDLFDMLVNINGFNPFYPPYDQEHGDHIVRESGFHALLEKYRPELGPRAGTLDTVKGLLEGIRKDGPTKEGEDKVEKRKAYIDHAKRLLANYGEHKFGREFEV